MTTAIFAILTYFVLPQTQLNSFVATIVAIFLPLSGMWAAANAHSRRIGGNKFGRRMMPLGPSDTRNGSTTLSSKKQLTSEGNTTFDEKTNSVGTSSFGRSPTKSSQGYKSDDRVSMISGLEDGRDLELGDGIRQDRTYTVHSQRG